jgi:integrin beta 2
MFIGQGSVEGLAYEAVNNVLYWTCNNDATINRIKLTNNESKVEQIIKLGTDDKPRGIDVDSCNMYVYIYLTCLHICKMH